MNYKKACIYEIVCKDVNITERYVGSTTNLIKRRYSHKNVCNNEKCKQYNLYVYQFIRENGGFENWDVILIEQVIDCQDTQNLHKRERYYMEEKKAELNKNIPLRTCKEYYEKNKNKLAEKQRIYCENNKDKVVESRKKYAEIYKQKKTPENKEVIAEYNKKHYENNKEKITEYQRVYRANNKEKITEYQRIYRANKKNLN
jgi:hypothetical protein